MLLDTSIVIDLLRGKSEAADFITTLPDPPCFSVITLMELEVGVRGEMEARQIESLLSVSRVYEVNRVISVRAGQIFRTYRASHGLDPLDALIAATAEIHELPLATLNLKHFPMFESLARPY